MALKPAGCSLSGGPAAVKAVLQRRGMFSLAGPVRMPGTRGRCQASDGGISLPAVFAGVLRLFRTLIGCVLPPAGTRRMPGARGCRQTPDTVVLLSAVLAIVPFHFYLLLCSFVSVDGFLPLSCGPETFPIIRAEDLASRFKQIPCQT